VQAGGHREAVGGLWDEIGQLQSTFWFRKGSCRITGCSTSLRQPSGRVKLIRYLDAGHYAGVDFA